VYQNNIQLI